VRRGESGSLWNKQETKSHKKVQEDHSRKGIHLPALESSQGNSRKLCQRKKELAGKSKNFCRRGEDGSLHQNSETGKMGTGPPRQINLKYPRLLREGKRNKFGSAKREEGEGGEARENIHQKRYHKRIHLTYQDTKPEGSEKESLN